MESVTSLPWDRDPASAVSSLFPLFLSCCCLPPSSSPVQQFSLTSSHEKFLFISYTFVDKCFLWNLMCFMSIFLFIGFIIPMPSRTPIFSLLCFRHSSRLSTHVLYYIHFTTSRYNQRYELFKCHNLFQWRVRAFIFIFHGFLGQCIVFSCIIFM